MDLKNVSRRRFVSGLAAALGYVSTGPSFDVLAQGRAAGQGRPVRVRAPAVVLRLKRNTTRSLNSPTTKTTTASPTR